MTFAGKLTWKRNPTAKALLILAHGAGADTSHPWFASVEPLLKACGWRVIFLDFPYRVQGRKAPDRLPTLQKTMREAAFRVANRHPSMPLFLGGKSMGGRVAATLLSEPGPWKGAMVFGYPLIPPGKPKKAIQRAEPLNSAKVPLAILQGTRDVFGAGKDLKKVLRKLCPIKIWDLEGGDHSFSFLKRSNLVFPEALTEPISRASEWLIKK